eukprot:TRINITY_DN11678_c0_g6_i1.p1 TRINITY_DN11678_c0_g6~~TRINITY_DN11678_c0_g6_i1.p1  ORF type:complete len:830 (+),score=156.64 TRINITY_DN11678_c0_g6_i1:114-2492(+)
MSAFEELGLCPEIIRAVEEDDWLLPTPVQQEAVPLILTGGDVLVAAETGSGKTGAFGLPCLQIVHETLRGKCQMRDNAAGHMRCELDPGDKDMSLEIGAGGLECSSGSGDRWCGVRANVEVLRGRYMFEVEVVRGLTRVGWSARSASLELGVEHRSFGYGSTGKKSWNKQFEDYGEPFEDGDVIGCLLDRDAQTISYFKNGRDLGVAFKIPVDLEDVGFRPHVCGKGFAAAARFDGPMVYPIAEVAAIGDILPTHLGSSKSAESGRAPLCLILEPTRELAEQTYKSMCKFGKHLEDPSVRAVLLVGGCDEREQLTTLERGTDICVGTLQKTADLMRRGKLDVSHVRFFVLDEADDLQKKDERRDIAELNERIKRSRKDRIQTLFFSATLHTEEVKQLIESLTVRPVWVDLKGKDSVPETVHHVVYQIDPERELAWNPEETAVHAKNSEEQPVLDGVHDKPSLSALDAQHPEALRMSENVKRMKPKVLLRIADAFKMTQCLVFCRTNVDCNNLESYFRRLGGERGGYTGKVESGKENPYSCVVLAGARNQGERRRSLEAFKDGDVRFLICTDVAARGLDISGLPFVVQMTLPDDIENYVHRVGRCGRAGHMGLAISLVSTRREKVWYHKCPSRGKNCLPAPGNTRLTVPSGADGKPLPVDSERWFVDEGGCTIWYDEPELASRIAERIGRPLALMDREDFTVPGLLESPLPEAQERRRAAEATGETEPPSRRALKRKLEEGPGKGTAAVVYGAKRRDAAAAAAASQATTIAPTVEELAGLEKKIQEIFAGALW